MVPRKEAGVVANSSRMKERVRSELKTKLLPKTESETKRILNLPGPAMGARRDTVQNVKGIINYHNTIAKESYHTCMSQSSRYFFEENQNTSLDKIRADISSHKFEVKLLNQEKLSHISEFSKTTTKRAGIANSNILHTQSIVKKPSIVENIKPTKAAPSVVQGSGTSYKDSIANSLQFKSLYSGGSKKTNSIPVYTQEKDHLKSSGNKSDKQGESVLGKVAGDHVFYFHYFNTGELVMCDLSTEEPQVNRVSSGKTRVVYWKKNKSLLVESGLLYTFVHKDGKKSLIELEGDPQLEVVDGAALVIYKSILF